MNETGKDSTGELRRRSPFGFGLLIVPGIMFFSLWTDHPAHLQGGLPLLWLLVLVNSAVFIIFAFNFTRPQTRRNSRSLGGLSAFILTLKLKVLITSDPLDVIGRKEIRKVKSDQIY